MHAPRTAVLATALIFAPALAAQQPPPAPPPAQASASPGIVVVTQNICPAENVSRLNQFMTQTFGPILDELMREGRITGWGVLNHLWGDEWNWSIYYTAADAAAFVSAFSEAVRRTNQRHPGAFAAILPLCSQHRDNFYNVVVTRTAANLPPAPAQR